MRVNEIGIAMVARKPFQFNGVEYKIGDAFPYDELAVPWRRVQVMVSSNMLAPVGMENARPHVIQKILSKGKPKIDNFKKMRAREEEKEKKATSKQRRRKREEADQDSINETGE